MAFVKLSSLKKIRFFPNELVKWKVVVLLSLTTLLIIYVTVPMVSVPPIDQFKRSQSIDQSHRPAPPTPSTVHLERNQSINQSHQPNTKYPVPPTPPTASLEQNQSINQFPRPKTKIIFMNKDLCATPVPEKTHRTAVIVILSARANFNRRNLVRQTYGAIRNVNNVQILAIIFMLAGTQNDNKVDMKKLQEERDQFGDTIMGDFIDSYRNLTRKTIMAYEWLTEHCKQAELVVKTDDDVVVNIFELSEQLDSLSKSDMVSSNIWGWMHYNENTIKDVKSVFYASPVDFPDGKFPDHCAGVGYVTTFGVIKRIIDDISSSYPGRVCTHEDVFMTGVVPIHINSNTTNPIKLLNQPLSVSYIFQNGREDKDEFLRNFVKNETMDKEIKNFQIFRERNNKRIYFLLAHSKDKEFELIYRRLWHIIKTTYST